MFLRFKMILNLWRSGLTIHTKCNFSWCLPLVVSNGQNSSIIFSSNTCKIVRHIFAMIFCLQWCVWNSVFVLSAPQLEINFFGNLRCRRIQSCISTAVKMWWCWIFRRYFQTEASKHYWRLKFIWAFKMTRIKCIVSSINSYLEFSIHR